jgi:solute carrier family 25 protein 39/40
MLHRSMAAAGASVVSAVVVNPLDVVKVRLLGLALLALNASLSLHSTFLRFSVCMPRYACRSMGAHTSAAAAAAGFPRPPPQTRLQAQGMDLSLRTLQPATSLLDKWNFAGCGSTCVRLANPALPPAACGPACEPVAYRGTLHALRSIAAAEGAGALWRGTHLALMMAVPMVGIYLPLYDHLLEDLQGRGASSLYAPLLAGTLARTAAVYCTAPFELVRVRMQAARAPAALPSPALAAAAGAGAGAASPGRLLAAAAMAGGGGAAAGGLRTFGRLWTGVGATLARDVPFSGLYWALVEPIRGALLPGGATSELEVVGANVTAGALAGGLSGAVTTPLDVVKTRTQLAAAGQRVGPMLGTLRSIAAGEGPAALFQGWSARAAKAAPACAIVLSAYEMLKFMPIDD